MRLRGFFDACHAGIRAELRRAGALASGAVEGPEVLAEAARLERFFGEGLSLHMKDEEQSLLPRLAGRLPEVDAVLGQMQLEHRDLDRLVVGYLEALSPLQLGGSAPALASVTQALAASVERHLAGEEQAVYPHLDALVSAELQAQALLEIRARHRQAFRSGLPVLYPQLGGGWAF